MPCENRVWNMFRWIRGASAVVTHVCSHGSKHPHSIQVDTEHMKGLRCGGDTWDTGQFWGHMTVGRYCQCCHCTDMAGTDHRLVQGCHNNQEHTGYSGALKFHVKSQCMSKKATATLSALELEFTSVALSTITDDLVRGVVSLTRMRIEVTWAWVTRAGTRPTVLPWTKHWISKESFHTTEN